jgi:hypothetical protein
MKQIGYDGFVSSEQWKLNLSPLPCLPVGRGGGEGGKDRSSPTFILPSKAEGKFSYDG